MWGWFFIAVGVVVALYGLHRLATWAAAKGWIFYRDSSRPAGTTSRAVSGVDVIFRPEVEHYIEMRDAEEIIREEDESGEPPTIEVD